MTTKLAWQKAQREAVLIALQRLQTGERFRRDALFEETTDAAKQFQRKILNRLKDDGLIRTDTLETHNHRIQYSLVEGRTLAPFIESPKALTALIWPSAIVAEDMFRRKKEYLEESESPVAEVEVLHSEEDIPKEGGEEVPPSIFQETVMKLLWAIVKEQENLRAAIIETDKKMDAALAILKKFEN